MRQGLWLMFICQAVLSLTAAKLETNSMGRPINRPETEARLDASNGTDYSAAESEAESEAELRPAAAQVKVTNEVESAAAGASNGNEEHENGTQNTTTNNSSNLMSPNTLPISEIHKFGSSGSQLAAEAQLLRLQDLKLLFNAERQTYFQLHTRSEESRLLQQLVGNTLSSAFGLNAVQKEGSGSVQVEAVRLYDATSLRQTRYNPFKPTRIIIHGWLGNAQANIFGTLVPVYLQLGAGYNVFTVDWGRGAIADYITASYRVKPVGQTLAKFIDFLHVEAGMRYEDLQLIGFSMGAHVAGIAGKHVQTGRVRLIRALDPALPFYRYAQEGERLAKSDADHVEVLHTSVGSYGFDRPLGHADFYANWGSQQPGCFWRECSHWRAFLLFAESLQLGGIVAQGCEATLWRQLTAQRSCLNETGRNTSMGGDLAEASLEALKAREGVYYFQTNDKAPYGQNG